MSWDGTVFGKYPLAIDDRIPEGCIVMVSGRQKFLGNLESGEIKQVSVCAICNMYHGPKDPCVRCLQCGMTGAHFCTGRRPMDQNEADRQRGIRPDYGVTQRRIDERASGSDERDKRVAELQAKSQLTEGERLELYRLLEQKWPRATPRVSF